MIRFLYHQPIERSEIQVDDSFRNVRGTMSTQLLIGHHVNSIILHGGQDKAQIYRRLFYYAFR